jgi:hypothetical protein
MSLFKRISDIPNEIKAFTFTNLFKEQINNLEELAGGIENVSNLSTYKLLLDEGEPDYITILEQNQGYVEKVRELIDENERLNDVCFNLTQENSIMDYRIKELESDLEDYYKVQDKFIDKYEDKYNERMIVAALEKTTDDKNIYKKVINELCDKYNIDHSEVFSIIDNIKDEKNNNIQRER